ncbi:ML-like domain-containing protein [Bipolaris maydis]|nr:ML-like domain-containing protein [Bipolaris maydis]
MRIQQHITFLLAIYLSLILSITFTIANQTEYVRATIKGIRTLVRDDRQPSLYTTDYADCLGNSAINITRFDAAYYKDNMTITFHLRGETALQDHIMLNIAVFAYGETRFSLTFNPCDANIWSACPVRPGTPIEAAAGIPELALSIPDFEGQAVMRVFANETESEIGWFAAGITNGWTFGQQDCVGAVLGGFTLVAVAALFATAVHYAHSIGAIEVDWPSVLLAFWSNYAWRMIDGFVGLKEGDEVRNRPADTGQSDRYIGGGVDIHQIFRRSTLPIESGLPNALENRGLQVKPGLPLPGDYSGFAGTLATQRIPVRNAFATGLLWLLFLSVCAIISILALKAVIEILATLHIVRQNRLKYFRCHYLAYIAAALLRIIFMSFFLITSLGTVAVACLVFVTVVLGLGSIAAEYVFEPDRINISKHRIFKVIPWYSISRNSGGPPLRDSVCVGSIPWWRIHAMADFPSIHSDEEYTVNRWWFFVVWLSYEFFRASFLAGASNQPTTIALVAFILLRPFEGQRLNVIAVYLLGFTFDPRFCIARIPATVIGIVIIVIQSLLTIAVMLLILIGAVSKMKPKTIAEQDIPRSRKRPDSEDIITVKRVAKIEDEDIEFMDEISQVPHPSPPVLSPNRTLVSNSPGSLLERSRTGSFQSQASYSSLLPRAARLHRANWSTHDLNDATRTRRHRAVSDTSLISRLRHVEKLERKPSLGGASMKRSDTPALLSYGYADGGSNGACGACGAG